MFGLMYDRSAVPEFRKSYRTLMSHLVQHQYDADSDPRERLAFFAIPVAFATVIVPVLAGLLWIIVANAPGQTTASTAAMYFVAGVLSVIATIVIGRATVEHRLLEREIAFNTTPLAANATGAGAPPVAAAGEVESPTRSRWGAAFVMFGGALLLVLNHLSVIHRQTYYPKLVYGGPIFVAVGLFALYEPRIMTRHLPIGKTYPRFVLILTLLAIALGGVCGWKLETWYHG
jgi:MFS family permease